MPQPIAVPALFFGGNKFCNGFAVPFECEKGHVFCDTIIRHMSENLVWRNDRQSHEGDFTLGNGGHFTAGFGRNRSLYIREQTLCSTSNTPAAIYFHAHAGDKFGVFGD